MNAAILLCAAMVAADYPTQVQAKVLYGTADEKQQRAEIEPWISNTVAMAGSPLTLPQSGWTALTGDFQRLFTSNGFIIDGKVIERNGKYEVEIDACAGASLDKKVRLTPGERRVINLTDNPAPNNVFIALKAPVRERVKKRTEAMKANAKTFRLDLNYNGEQGKPFYRLIVSVPVIPQLASDPFCRIVQVKEDEAIRIIDHLAKDGFLDSAVDLRTNIKIPPPTMPGYTIKVVTGDIPLYQDLGWGLSMIQRLDALHAALPESGKKDMEFLLSRLSGLRKQWEAKAKPK